MMSKLIWATALALLFGAHANAQELEIVYDLNTTDYSHSGAEPANFVEYNGSLYFTGETAEYGKEVYRIDGDSVVLGIDIAPGTAWSTPEELVVWNGKLYIVAFLADHNYQIFEFDGTNSTMITNFIVPSQASPDTYQPRMLVGFGNQLCFVGYDAASGLELYSYDGTSVSMVTDLNPGTDSGMQPYGSMAEYNGNLYFSGTAATGGDQLYSYDGTNVSLAATVNASGAAQVYDFRVGAGNLWFTANNGTAWGIPYSWDGSALTDHSADIGVWAYIHGPLNGNMIAAGKEFPGTANENQVLLEYDGTSWTTVLDFTPSSQWWSVEGLGITNGLYYFEADSGSVSEGIWTWDGTTVGQIIVPADHYYLANFTYFNGETYLSAEAPNEYEELFRLSGGTIELVEDMVVANESGFEAYGGTAVFGGQLYFAGNSAATGTELFRYSGTGVPELVGEIAAGPQTSEIDNIFKWRNELYFSADTSGGSDADLYKYDGTAISLVHSAETNYGPFSALGNKLCMRTGSYGVGVGIEFSWFNGTTFTTMDLVPGAGPIGTQGSSNPSGFIKYNNELYFNANLGLGVELYKFNGTHVSLVADINPDTLFNGQPYSSQPLDPVVYNGLLYFSAQSSVSSGRDLYAYDGTTITLQAGPNTNMQPTGMVVWDGLIYMGATTTGNGGELFSFDGASYTLVDDYVPGADGSNVRPLIGTCDHLLLDDGYGTPYALTTSGSIIEFGGFPTHPQYSANTYASDLIEFQGQIYCGINHPYLGVELARWNEATNLDNPHEYNVDDASATLRWDAADIADEYQVQYRQAGVSGITLVSTGTTAEYALTGLTATTVYWWRVRKKCNNTPRQWTEWQRFTTLATPCPLPTGLATGFVAPNQGKAKSTWNAVATAVKYNLRVRIQGDSVWNHSIVSANHTKKWWLNMQPDTVYEWGISCHCAFGLGLDGMPWSATQTFNLGATAKHGQLADVEALQAFHPEVFPNPNSGSFTVNLGAHNHPVTTTLYDLSGREVAQKVVDSETTSMQFEEEGLTSGMYVLKIASSDLVVQERIVVR